MFENDITMCMTENCPKKDECYRQTAKPDRFQSYSLFGPVCCDNNSFAYFMDNEKSSEKGEKHYGKSKSVRPLG